MRNAVLFVLGLWCLSGETRANCVSDLLSGQSQLMKCMTDLGASMQTIDYSNPKAMCTGPVKDSMNCLTSFMRQCPQLTKMGTPFASMLPAIKEYESNCNNMTAARCPEFEACTKKVEEFGRSKAMEPSGQSTPFSLIPTIVFSVCDVFKQQLACLEANRAACPDVVKTSEAAIASSIDEDKTVSMDFNGMKMIIKEQCPKIPADFATNTCVREKLESSGFVSCISMVKKFSAQATKMEQCKFYFDGKACIEDYIGNPCGQQNAKAIVDNAHMVINDLPQDCQPPNKVNDKSVGDNPGNHGDSSKTHCIIATLFVCLIAAFLHIL